MFIIILLAALALTGLVATIIELRRDGFHAAPTNWTRVAEHSSSQDAESAHIYR